MDTARAAPPGIEPKEAAMLTIAGKLYVHPQERDRWVTAHDEITRTARSQPRCSGLTAQPARWRKAGSTCSSCGNPKRHCRHGGRPQIRRPSPRS
jgi:hypothetical protein